MRGKKVWEERHDKRNRRKEDETEEDCKGREGDEFIVQSGRNEWRVMWLWKEKVCEESTNGKQGKEKIRE